MECVIKFVLNPRLPEGISVRLDIAPAAAFIKVRAHRAHNILYVLDAASKRALVSGVKKLRFNWKGCPAWVAGSAEIKARAARLVVMDPPECDLSSFVALTYRHCRNHIAVPDFRRIDEEAYQPRIINYVRHLCGRTRLSDEQCLQIAEGVLEMCERDAAEFPL